MDPATRASSSRIVWPQIRTWPVVACGPGARPVGHGQASDIAVSIQQRHSGGRSGHRRESVSKRVAPHAQECRRRCRLTSDLDPISSRRGAHHQRQPDHRIVWRQIRTCVRACMRTCMCMCVRACVCRYMCACERACVRACVRMCACVGWHLHGHVIDPGCADSSRQRLHALHQLLLGVPAHVLARNTCVRGVHCMCIRPHA